MPEHRPPAYTPPTAPQDEPWAELRALTAARIALPRAGASLATAPQLDLRLAHARARDAVHATLDEARLIAELAPLGLPVLAVASAAADRTQYLMRPDLGRRLDGDADARLAAHAAGGHDVVFVIGAFPSPLWGGVRGGGDCVRQRRCPPQPSPSRLRACPLPANLKMTKPRQAGVWLGEGAHRVCGGGSNLAAITRSLECAHPTH